MPANHNFFDPNLMCPLCGQRNVNHDGEKYKSREHIPPQSMFVERTNDLITVPSCTECNAGTNKLDAKFKSSMGIYLGYKAPAFWHKALQTLNYKGNYNYKKQIISNTSPILIPIGRGNWGYQTRFEKKPITVVVNKICRGLHWHITHEVLPSDAEVDIHLIKQDTNLDPEIKVILDLHGKWIQTGNGAFQAQYGIANDHKYASLWLIRFYNQDCFIVSITPNKTKKD